MSKKIINILCIKSSFTKSSFQEKNTKKENIKFTILIIREQKMLNRMHSFQNTNNYLVEY